jgi:hypothetical protein
MPLVFSVLECVQWLLATPPVQGVLFLVVAPGSKAAIAVRLNWAEEPAARNWLVGSHVAAVRLQGNSPVATSDRTAITRVSLILFIFIIVLNCLLVSVK